MSLSNYKFFKTPPCERADERARGYRAAGGKPVVYDGHKGWTLRLFSKVINRWVQTVEWQLDCLA